VDLHPVVIPAGADQLPLLPVGEEGVLVLLLVEVLGGPAFLILLVVLLDLLEQQAPLGAQLRLGTGQHVADRELGLGLRLDLTHSDTPAPAAFWTP
jgi:hypothetical protein